MLQWRANSGPFRAGLASMIDDVGEEHDADGDVRLERDRRSFRGFLIEHGAELGRCGACGHAELLLDVEVIGGRGAAKRAQHSRAV